MKVFLHFMAFILIQFLFCSFQTSFWFQTFGQTPAPQLWLCVLVYWSLYRSSLATLPLIYFIAAISSSMSSAPMSHLLFLCSLLFCALIFFKSRIYWSGPIYYLLVCGLASLCYPIFYFIMTWALDDQPIRSFEFFHLILSTLLTMSLALPLYRLFKSVDRLLGPEALLDSIAERTL